MRVIYSTAPKTYWVGMAERLRDDAGLEPVYWLAPGSVLDHVRRAFPGVPAHDRPRAMRGVPAEGFEWAAHAPIDTELVRQYAPYERVALRMMDRMAMSDGFPLDERVQLFYRQLAYWRNVVERLRPDLVVFHDVPHLIADYVLYATCRLLDVRTVMFQRTFIPGYFFLSEGFEGDLPTPFQRAYQATDAASVAPADGAESPLPEAVERYLVRLRSSYDEGRPWYIPEEGEPEEKPGERARRLLRAVPGLTSLYDILRHRIPDFADQASLVSRPVKRPDRPIEDDAITNAEWRAWRRQALAFRDALKGRYQALIEPPSQGTRYVFVALHYQPERTTSPEGGVYHDQQLMVGLLSQTVPEGWEVVVKEHPMQFRWFGDQGRSLRFYDDLVAHRNVRLAPVTADPYRLMDGAAAVATVTGTAGWEAAIRGVPALVFGHAWYRGCEGVFRIRTAEQCRSALERIADGYRVDRAEVDRFVRVVSRESYQGDIHIAGVPALDVSPEENARVTARALREHLGLAVAP